MPIAGMTLGGVVLLLLLVAFLIARFNDTALHREQHMVEQGFQRQLEQYDEVLDPMIDWDKAVAKLDNRFDVAFADTEFGDQLYTFNGFTRTFFLDGAGQLVYATRDGRHVDPVAFRPFAAITAQLLVPVRAAEARRPPIRPDPRIHGPLTRPIQANGLVRAEGTVYIVIVSLIQPDLGRVLPKGPRAPAAITAMPIAQSMLNGFAARYLVDDLQLVGISPASDGKAYFPLRSPSGQEIAALAWTPRRPGTALYHEMRPGLIGALVLLGLIGWIIIHRSGVIVDELIASKEHANHLAYHDQLTHLPNRAMLFERLPVLLDSMGTNQQLLGVLLVDLDRFKEVNDTLGHQAGDDMIKAVGERLRAASAALGGALVARLGGDEFVLLCLASRRAAVADLADRCLSLIQQPVESEFGRLNVGCSIGVAIIEAGDLAPSLVLRRADLALYHSKALGRGRVTVFEPSMDEALNNRRKLEHNLRAALVAGDFRMEYQPQVDCFGNILAVEALLRWTHPELGEISPAVFVPVAEEVGLITAIGEFVLRRVFAETKDWPDIRVAINVSAIQMRTPGFPAQVLQLMACAGIAPARYEIEVTETALLGDDAATLDNFAALRRLGFSIVLDDFGTGYSSLSLLHRFKVDKIKIDRSFVSALGESDKVEGLVEAIVKLAKSFQLGVIAEGVETEHQRQHLLSAGCTEFQGFLTGLPMPAAEVAKLFRPTRDRRRHG